MQAGEQARCGLILIKGNVDNLLKDGKIVPGTDTLFGAIDLRRSASKPGTPKPDISNAGWRFKKSAAGRARRVSYSDPATGGASGVYIAKQIEKMGITEQLKGKTKLSALRWTFADTLSGERRSRHRHPVEA